MAKTGTIHDYFTQPTYRAAYAPLAEPVEEEEAHIEPIDAELLETIARIDFVSIDEDDGELVFHDGRGGYADLDARCVAESNVAVARARLEDKLGVGGDGFQLDYGDLHVTIHDCTGQFTPAFLLACEMIEELSDYPLLDDCEYSDRVWCYAEETADDYLEEAATLFDEGIKAVEERLYMCMGDHLSSDNSREENIHMVAVYLAQFEIQQG